MYAGCGLLLELDCNLMIGLGIVGKARCLRHGCKGDR